MNKDNEEVKIIELITNNLGESINKTHEVLVREGKDIDSGKWREAVRHSLVIVLGSVIYTSPSSENILKETFIGLEIVINNEKKIRK